MKHVDPSCHPKSPNQTTPPRFLHYLTPTAPLKTTVIFVCPSVSPPTPPPPSTLLNLAHLQALGRIYRTPFLVLHHTLEPFKPSKPPLPSGTFPPHFAAHPKMAFARRLSTAELGAKRYDAAQASGLWPIQVRLPPHLDGSTHVLLSASHPPTDFEPDSHGGYRASLSVPTGVFKYEIWNGKHKGQLVSMGGLDVTEAEMPLTGRGLAKTLTERPESGGTHIARGDHGHQLVQFVYQEETWAAKAVTVVGTGLELELERAMDGAFRATAEVPAGVLMYRFCVTPREATNVDVAPFTRLGWDDACSTPVKLVTWPIEMEVKPQEVKPREVKETQVVNDVVAEPCCEEEDKRVGGGGVLWGAAVALAAVACAFGASITMMLLGKEAEGDGGLDSRIDASVGGGSGGAVSVSVGAGVRGGAEKGVDAVLRHARGQAF
eukprot:GFKZ01008214.1.p1 GENE.GFKZ01008214.1~~GFKZ01008214.1.p1  ORF type:complete len:434 (-),score=54.08 GFKZ01008214.1:465-1766(-)